MHMEVECPNCKRHMILVRDPNRHKKWHIKLIDRQEIRIDVDKPQLPTIIDPDVEVKDGHTSVD